MRGAQCAHLFTDAKNEKDVHDSVQLFFALSQNLGRL
jgi:hypothetical protein